MRRVEYADDLSPAGQVVLYIAAVWCGMSNVAFMVVFPSIPSTSYLRIIPFGRRSTQTHRSPPNLIFSRGRISRQASGRFQEIHRKTTPLLIIQPCDCHTHPIILLSSIQCVPALSRTFLRCSLMSSAVLPILQLLSSASPRIELQTFLVQNPKITAALTPTHCPVCRPTMSAIMA